VNDLLTCDFSCSFSFDKSPSPIFDKVYPAASQVRPKRMQMPHLACPIPKDEQSRKCRRCPYPPEKRYRVCSFYGGQVISGVSWKKWTRGLHSEFDEHTSYEVAKLGLRIQNVFLPYEGRHKSTTPTTILRIINDPTCFAYYTHPVAKSRAQDVSICQRPEEVRRS